ncbi:hypothetical protein GPECTOR_97g760 [Gonium pectorale]|uniref:RING-type domain-containing protein n=1 Tax=Gonium pectorale TaxID=33097 RepID=A0A150G045_GONPE|nr:hypothetical protein GPECTOR_97g760 [Gonium pectorale]|eukprot:KXZ43222.1 hypothetical protein GPECTOR_97g760 [Gonium pectorale]
MSSLRKAFARLGMKEDDDYYEEVEYEDYEQDQEAKPAEARATEGTGADGGEVCAICLTAIEPVDLAIIKGCEHEYCVHCILQWAVVKEQTAASCPQCKAPFNYIFCHRLLDGTLSDAPVEESVCLLKRASWFVDHVKVLEKGKALSAAMAAEEAVGDWQELYDEDDYDYDDDEQLEKYYFSSAAGRARVVLGNRRLGENGYMRAGRMYARPVNGAASLPGSSVNANGGTCKAVKLRAPGSKSTVWDNPGAEAAPAAGSSAASRSGARGGAAGGSSGAGGSSSGSGSGAGPSGSSNSAASSASKGQGRRAKRNARRAAADLVMDLDFD